MLLDFLKQLHAFHLDRLPGNGKLLFCIQDTRVIAAGLQSTNARLRGIEGLLSVAQARFHAVSSGLRALPPHRHDVLLRLSKGLLR